MPSNAVEQGGTLENLQSLDRLPPHAYRPQVEVEVRSRELALKVDAVELATAVEPHFDGGGADGRRIDRKPRQHRRQLAHGGRDVQSSPGALEAVAAGEAARAVGPPREVYPLERKVVSADRRRAVDVRQRVDDDVRPQRVDATKRLFGALEELDGLRRRFRTRPPRKR